MAENRKNIIKYDYLAMLTKKAILFSYNVKKTKLWVKKGKRALPVFMQKQAVLFYYRNGILSFGFFFGGFGVFGKN